MKCPLLSIGLVMKGSGWDSGDDACKGEECGWWDPDHGVCTIKSIDIELDRLCSHLCDLVDKMPHELQFRK